MADNILVTPGSGDTAVSVKTDEVSSKHYQVIKLDAGGDGVSVPVLTGQQAQIGPHPLISSIAMSKTPAVREEV